MKNILVPFKRLDHAAELPDPFYATPQSAGMDLYSANLDDITVPSGQSALIPTGLCFAIPNGYEGQVRPRSGLALKHKVTVLNAPGTIDADYRGEVQIILINHGHGDFVITRGTRVAQMIFASSPQAQLQQVAHFDETTQRGAGGFGSTGMTSSKAI